MKLLIILYNINLYSRPHFILFIHYKLSIILTAVIMSTCPIFTYNYLYPLVSELLTMQMLPENYEIQAVCVIVSSHSIHYLHVFSKVWNEWSKLDHYSLFHSMSTMSCCILQRFVMVRVEELMNLKKLAITTLGFVNLNYFIKLLNLLNIFSNCYKNFKTMTLLSYDQLLLKLRQKCSRHFIECLGKVYYMFYLILCRSYFGQSSKYFLI